MNKKSGFKILTDLRFLIQKTTDRKLIYIYLLEPDGGLLLCRTHRLLCRSSLSGVSSTTRLAIRSASSSHPAMAAADLNLGLKKICDSFPISSGFDSIGWRSDPSGNISDRIPIGEEDHQRETEQIWKNSEGESGERDEFEAITLATVDFFLLYLNVIRSPSSTATIPG